MLTNKQNKQTAITRELTATKTLVWWGYLEKASKQLHITCFHRQLSITLIGACVVRRSIDKI